MFSEILWKKLYRGLDNNILSNIYQVKVSSNIYFKNK